MHQAITNSHPGQFTCNTDQTGRWVGAVPGAPPSQAMEGTGGACLPAGPWKAGPGVMPGPILAKWWEIRVLNIL
jgi:hypothetical protein